MNVYVTFGGRAYDETIDRIVVDGPKFGADAVRVYDDRWLIGHEFYGLNNWLWNTETAFGFGWCSWKPLIILDAFEKLNDGDVVLYTDADTYPIADFSVLFRECSREGIYLFEEQGCINGVWTKRDCFATMAQDEQRYRDAPHSCGRFQLFQKGPWKAKQFLMEWLTYNVNPRCQLWDQSILLPDHPEFRRHSCEQSVLTNLAHKYGVPLHRTPDQNGSVDRDYDIYPQLFFQEYCSADRSDLSGSRFFNGANRHQIASL